MKESTEKPPSSKITKKYKITKNGKFVILDLNAICTLILKNKINYEDINNISDSLMKEILNYNPKIIKHIEKLSKKQ